MLPEATKPTLMGMTQTPFGSRIRRVLRAIVRSYTSSAPYYLHFLGVGPISPAFERRTAP